MIKKIVIARSNAVEPDSRVEKEANSLAKAGYDVTILAWDRSNNYRIREDKKTLADSSVRRISFGCKAGFGDGLKSLKSYLLFQKRLFCWLVKNKNEYDIAHLCDFDTAFFGSKAARLCKKQYIFDIFDYLSTDANNLFQKVIKHAEDNIINHSTATIICTEERRQQIRDAKPAKLVIVHNTPEAIEIENSKRKTDKKKIKICYVGILQDYRLIKEMVHAIENMDYLELHIGGFGKYEEDIKTEAINHGNIIYYGKLQYKDTIALENDCDIMTAIYDPSIGNHYYAAPNKFYEALFLGKPLIMVKGTGMSNVIKENDLGELIDFSEEGFILGVKNLVDRKDEWKEMKKRMQKIYKEEYSWSEMEKRLYSLYEEL